MKDYFGELELPEEEYRRPKARYVNYEGERYCSWLVLKKMTKYKYLCRCDCGFEQVRDIYTLQRRGIECINCYKKSKHYKLFKGS